MGLEVHGLTDERGAARFLGIPYARQPVGRWEEAQPSWQDPSSSSVPPLLAPFDATGRTPPTVCPQVLNGLVMGSEDCLFVNVYRPAFTEPESLKPVMVFIHGGSFILGGIASPLLDGHALAAEQDTVVVTISYRLGALGFLADPSSAGQGNLAMLDQQLAFKWVHSNIKYFGGDPSAITLAGESAGAYSVCLHMLVPDSRELLRAVILESGGCVGLPLEEGVARAKAFAATVGCGSNSSSSIIECLRQVPLEVLVPASTALGQQKYHFWTPLIDGDRFLTSSPAELLNSSPSSSLPSSLPPLPTLLGFNRDEGTLFLSATGLAGQNGTDLAYSSWVRSGKMEKQEGLPPLLPSQREEILMLYPPRGDGLNSENVVNIIADAHYKCPSYFFASRYGGKKQEEEQRQQQQQEEEERQEEQQQQQNDPGSASSIYFYRFQYVQPEACNPHADDLRCYHGSELPYIWAKPRLTPCGAGRENEVGREEEEEMARTMQAYWGAFVRSMGRSPNGEGEKRREGGEAWAMMTGRRRMRGWAGGKSRGLRGAEFRFGKVVEWPRFEEEEEEGKEGWLLLQLDAGNITVVPRDRKRECEFWDMTDVYSK